MREIKFRGKSRISEKWNFGHLTNIRSMGFGLSIKNPEAGVTVSVYSESVGQYTEFKDTNMKEIYDGDILKCHDGLHGKDFIGIVKMQDGCWSVDFSHLPDGYRPFDSKIGWNRDSDYLKMYHPVLGNSMEVIGNIHENPELIERQ